jgi:hypothetical protein
MSNAVNTYFHSDPTTPAVKEFIADMNASKYTIPVRFGTIGDSNTTAKLLMMAYDDVVIEDVLFNSDVTLNSATDAIGVEVYAAWGVNTAGAGGTAKCSLTNFLAGANNKAAEAMHSMKATVAAGTAGAIVGNFPFVVTKNSFVVVYITNNEGGDIKPSATAVFSLLKDHITLPPAIPAPPITKTIRVEKSTAHRAMEKYFPTDTAPTPIRDYISDVNSNGYLLPYTIGSVAGAATTAALLITMANEDLVIEDLFFCTSHIMDNAGDVVGVEVLTAWDVDKAAGTGTTMVSLTGFAGALAMAASTWYSLKAKTCTTKVGAFPFLVEKDQFLTMYTTNGHGGGGHAEILAATALIAHLKDHVKTPPSQPVPMLTKVIRAQ